MLHFLARLSLRDFLRDLPFGRSHERRHPPLRRPLQGLLVRLDA